MLEGIFFLDKRKSGCKRLFICKVNAIYSNAQKLEGDEGPLYHLMYKQLHTREKDYGTEVWRYILLNFVTLDEISPNLYGHSFVSSENQRFKQASGRK